VVEYYEHLGVAVAQLTITSSVSTSTTVTTSRNPSVYGAPVTFTATVSPTAATGTVTLLDGATSIGTGTLTSAGVATFTTSALTTGVHSITAVYGGDSVFTSSTSPLISQTVTPKALTITATNQSKTYGTTAALGTTAFTPSGLVNSDTVTGVTLASGGSPAGATVGTYLITPSAATGTGLTNYTITYANGTLTVTPKALTITATNRSKTYGSSLALGTTAFTTSGLVNGNTVSSVTLTSAGTAASAPVGTYPIFPSAASGSGLSNYTIGYVNGTLTVKR
jgi:hypothetical protein